MGLLRVHPVPPIALHDAHNVQVQTVHLRADRSKALAVPLKMIIKMHMCKLYALVPHNVQNIVH